MASRIILAASTISNTQGKTHVRRKNGRNWKAETSKFSSWQYFFAFGFTVMLLLSEMPIVTRDSLAFCVVRSFKVCFFPIPVSRFLMRWSSKPMTTYRG